VVRGAIVDDDNLLAVPDCLAFGNGMKGLKEMVRTGIVDRHYDRELGLHYFLNFWVVWSAPLNQRSQA
jgi:hypothetical protein